MAFEFCRAFAPGAAVRRSVCPPACAPPSPGALRYALRDVIGRCMYGIDINPMSVELCKVSLYLEAMDAGKPLSFLDHHIICGNSLLGAESQALLQLIPNSAFTALIGDNKKACTMLRKRNDTYLNNVFPPAAKRERENLLARQWQNDVRALMDVASPPSINALPANTIEALKEQEAAYAAWIGSPAWQKKKLLFDMWCAAFVMPKYFPQGAGDSPTGITSSTLHDFVSGRGNTAEAEAIARNMAQQYKFFHMALNFPEVESKGGFDVVLGNPPWERIKLQEKEWFAAAECYDIAGAKTADIRKGMIAKLKEESPAIYAAYMNDLRHIDGQGHFLRASGIYPFCGRGDINLYAVFAEKMRRMLSPKGRLGCIVPSGIASDDTTKFFFQNLTDTQALVSLFDFENREKIFPAIDSRIKFSLLTCAGGAAAQGAEFVFFAHSTEDLRDNNRRFTLSKQDIALLNPNTRTCPIFRSKKDAELTKAIYRRVPVLVREAQNNMPEQNPWGITFNRMFDMSNDSHLFYTKERLESAGLSLQGNVFVRQASNGAERCLPLYEAKMVHHFNHRWAAFSSMGDEVRDTTLEEREDQNFSPLPRYWVHEAEVKEELKRTMWQHDWFIGVRGITNATNERTVVGAAFPLSAVGNSLPVWLSNNAHIAYLPAVLSCYALDFAARFKVGGMNFNFFIIEQLPVLPPCVLTAPAPWNPAITVANWLKPRVLELTYTAQDMRPFARDLGCSGEPFAWNEARRFNLRAELDAAFFHLYLPSNPDGTWKAAKNETPAEYAALCASFPTPREAVDYIMETFPIVKRRDIKEHNTYRTKEAILKAYDALMPKA